MEQDQGRRRQPRQHNEISEQPTTSSHTLPSSSIDLQQEETEREGDGKDSEDDESSEDDEISTYNIRRRKRTKLVMPKTKRSPTNKKQKPTKDVDTLTPLQSTTDSSNRTKKSNKTLTRNSARERRERENEIQEASIPPTCTLISNSSHVSLKPFTLAISRLPIEEGPSIRGGDKGTSASSNHSKVTPAVPGSLSDRPGSGSEWEMSSEISIQNFTENRRKSETVRDMSREMTGKTNEGSKDRGKETDDMSIIGRRRRNVEQKVHIILTSDESEFEEEKSKSEIERKAQSPLMTKRSSSRRKVPVVSYKEESEEESESSSSLVTDEEVHVPVSKKAKDKRVEKPKQHKRAARTIYDSDGEEIDEEGRNEDSVSPFQSKRDIPESDESDVPETPQKTTRLTRLNLLRLSNANPLTPPLRRRNDCTASPIPRLSSPLLVASPQGSPSKHSSPLKQTNKRGRQIQSSPIKDRASSQTETPSPRMVTRSNREALQEKQNESHPMTKRITRTCPGNNDNTGTSSVSCTSRTNSQSDTTTGDTASSVTENERNSKGPVSLKELPPPSKQPKKRRKMSRPLPLPLVNQSG